MTDFIVGGKSVSSPLLPESEINLIQKENALLEPTTLASMPEIKLTDDQTAAISQVQNAIDVTDDNVILSYGLDESNKLSKLTDSTLSQVNTRDMGEIGAAITALTAQLTISDDKQARGLSKLFNRTKNKLKGLQIQYESAQQNIERVTNTLESHQITLTRNNKDLLDVKQANLENFQRLTVYVGAGKAKVEELTATKLVELQELAKSGDQTAVNNLTEFKNKLDLFDKQLHDLDAVMSLSQAMAIQLETITNGNKALIQKINRSRNIMIPAWKNYMMIAFYNEQSKQALAADKAASDATNNLLKEVGKSLRITNSEIAEQSERSAIDITTLESMTGDIVASLQDIEQARIKGKANREAATTRMVELRDTLKQQLVTTVTASNN